MVSSLKRNTPLSIKRPFDGHASQGLPGQCFRASLGRCWKDGQKDGLLENVEACTYGLSLAASASALAVTCSNVAL